MHSVVLFFFPRCRPGLGFSRRSRGPFRSTNPRTTHESLETTEPHSRRGTCRKQGERERERDRTRAQLRKQSTSEAEPSGLKSIDQHVRSYLPFSLGLFPSFFWFVVATGGPAEAVGQGRVRQRAKEGQDPQLLHRLRKGEGTSEQRARSGGVVALCIGLAEGPRQASGMKNYPLTFEIAFTKRGRASCARCGVCPPFVRASVHLVGAVRLSAQSIDWSTLDSARCRHNKTCPPGSHRRG